MLPKDGLEYTQSTTIQKKNQLIWTYESTGNRFAKQVHEVENLGLRNITGVAELGAARTMAGLWWPPVAGAAWRGLGEAWEGRGSVEERPGRPDPAGSGPGMAMAPGAMSSKLELASNGGHGGCCKEEEEA
jgi:hypothetical protein